MTNHHGGTHSGDYDHTTEQEHDMTTQPTQPTQQPLIEPGIGESAEGLFSEPSKQIARVKGVIGAVFALAGTLGVTFVAGDAEVQALTENIASLVITLVATAMVFWNAISQGTRTRSAVFSPESVSKLNTPGGTVANVASTVADRVTDEGGPADTVKREIEKRR